MVLSKLERRLSARRLHLRTWIQFPTPHVVLWLSVSTPRRTVERPPHNLPPSTIDPRTVVGKEKKKLVLSIEIPFTSWKLKSRLFSEELELYIVWLFDSLIPEVLSSVQSYREYPSFKIQSRLGKNKKLNSEYGLN